MPEGIEITVRNKLITEKRDLNVYHQANRSAYMISHGNSITISLGTVEDGDYLYLSIVSGPGSMEKDYWLNLPYYGLKNTKQKRKQTNKVQYNNK